MKSRALILLLLLCCGIPHMAQNDISVRPNQKIKVTTLTNPDVPVFGALYCVNDSFISVRRDSYVSAGNLDNAIANIRVQDIRKITFPERRLTLEGLAIGAGVGLLTGFIALTVTEPHTGGICFGGDCISWTYKTIWQRPLFFTAMGAGAGAAAGAFLHLNFKIDGSMTRYNNRKKALDGHAYVKGYY